MPLKTITLSSIKTLKCVKTENDPREQDDSSEDHESVGVLTC